MVSDPGVAGGGTVLGSFKTYTGQQLCRRAPAAFPVKFTWHSPACLRFLSDGLSVSWVFVCLFHLCKHLGVFTVDGYEMGNLYA